LSIILTYGAMVRDELGPTGRGFEDVKQILRAGERAAALTQQLLAFSRQQVVQPKIIALGAVLSGMKPMLARLLGEDIEVTFVAPEPFGRVLADPTQLEQVVMNLAVNARDAMPRGGRLAIEVRNVELEGATDPAAPRAGPYVNVSMADSGMGMNAETRARIFDPFFTTKERGKGTGLGLSIVFGIVQQAGGRITVESEPGRGSRFDIFLPRTDRAADQAAPAAPAPVTLRGSESVLLVEDDDQLRQTMAAVLRRSGYAVTEARNGEEAVALGESAGPTIDLLVTDVVMPRLDGPALAARLLPTRPGLRVLYVSGYWENILTERDVLGGAFLQKPIVPETFLRKVREVLAGPRR
jgi:CheY-like chemotaxis protein